VYSDADGRLQATAAPRFSGTPTGAPGAIPNRGADSEKVLRDWLGKGAAAEGGEGE
jgi:crotonobetainyl-CoA:carnitine CoA-transferase CaiB-like acyl-CoA transferase